jgi:RNA polymerase sigma-70 factor (ECF subfamily)
MKNVQLTDEYIRLRSYLWTVAYDMTGEIHEAEDIVQDGFEIVSKVSDQHVANPKAYFTRIIINKSIDRQKELQKQRIEYPGPWLPEPYVTPDDSQLNESILPYAMMHLAERLNPVERAVFILREAFSYSYAEIAGFCNISEANSRQLLHRAKEKIKKTGAATTAVSPRTASLTEAFIQATLRGNHEELKALLDEDIRLYSDGGGKAVAARNALDGWMNVGKFFIGIVRHRQEQWSRAVKAHINNSPALLMFNEGQLETVAIFDTDGNTIKGIYLVRNPEKIFHLNLSQKSELTDI